MRDTVHRFRARPSCASERDTASGASRPVEPEERPPAPPGPPPGSGRRALVRSRVVLAPFRPSRLAWCFGLVALLHGTTATAATATVAAAKAPKGAAKADAPAKRAATEPTGDTEAGDRTTVVIAIPESDATLREATLRPALEGHFADTRFRPELRLLPPGDILAHLEWAEAHAGDPSSTAPGAPKASHAVLWIETGRDGAQQLYLLQPSSGRVWVRALPMASEPEVAAESLGVMVRALALGLEDGAPAGMREVTIVREGDGPAKAEPVAPPPPPEPRPDVLVAVGYHGSSVSADRPWHSGAELRLGVRLPVGLLLELGAAWAPKAAGRRSPRVDLERIPIDLRLGWQWRPHPRVHPQVDASVVGEALRWAVPSTDEIAGRRGTAWRVGVAPGAGVTFRLWRALGLRVHAQADVWIRNAELVIVDGDARPSLTRMHPVSGRLDAGLAIWL